MSDGETLTQQINSLKQTVLNLQALADTLREQGDFVEAQTLSSKSVTLANQLLTLSSERQDAVIASDAWAELGAEMDKLNAQAKATQGDMQSAEANVKSAKTLISLVGKLAAVL